MNHPVNRLRIMGNRIPQVEAILKCILSMRSVQEINTALLGTRESDVNSVPLPYSTSAVGECKHFMLLLTGMTRKRCRKVSPASRTSFPPCPVQWCHKKKRI